MNFLRNHPLYSILIVLVIMFIIGAYQGSKRIDRTAETVVGEHGYVRPLWQD